MRTKIYLTSIIAMSFAMPALAGTFPLDGLMKENKTYENAAISTNMAGVSSGTVYANAQYEDTEYPLTAGKYLPANSETVTDCLDGSYCDGLTSPVNYNASTAQGIQSCPNGYNHSDANASADTQCYRTCDIANMGANGSIANIAHAATLTGNDYYGNGTDTCEPATCDNGYHKQDAINASAIQTAVGTGAGASRAYIDNGNSFTEDGASYGQSFYGINDANTWAVNYGNNGILVGQARCSTRAGAQDTWANNTYNSEGNIVSSLTDETGQTGAQYCYCNVTGYKASSGAALQSLSSSWVFDDDYGYASNCASSCAIYCARNMRVTDSNILAYRAAVLGSVGASLASCEANTITINWNGTTQTEIDANEAGTATYGGNIRTPRSATPVAGKTFTGWLFSTTAPSGN